MQHPLEKSLLTHLLPRQDQNHEKWLAEIHPALRLKISPRARRIALRLDQKDFVMNLVVPPRYSMRKARQFASEHQEWIVQKMGELPAPIPFLDGVVLPVLGHDRQLRIVFDPNVKITRIVMHDDHILVHTNRDDPSARLERFFKQQAGKELSEIAKNKAIRIRKTIRGISIRDTKSRWGSCGQDGQISLSWRLIFAHPDAIDYVVAHEVAHLAHMNHSKKFWAQCAALCENYEAGKSWIRIHGHSLMRYGMKKA